MNTFKKKSLHAAVLAGLGALGVAGTANAVHINPEGLGQVLIFPYYTVRNGNVTAMSIVNTTAVTKAVKVRFLEGKNSREVLDFNLFLSPFDVWTGVVVPTALGAQLETGDNSCVTPSDLFSGTTVRTDGLGLPINAFKNYQYTGTLVDAATLNSLDRTREGYMEVIEMGVVIDAALNTAIKHGATGVPANCAGLDNYDALSTSATPAVKLPGTLVGATTSTQYLAPPAGGLFGRASIINSANGTNYAFGTTALDSWFNPPIPTLPPYSASGNVNPSLSSQPGIDTTSLVFVSDQPASGGFPASAAGVVRATWATSQDAVSSVFMRSEVINEFLTDAATLSRSDWVITMPTKRDRIAVGVGTPNRPFSNNFSTAGTGACDAYGLAIFNREEGTIGSTPGVILPSPRPPAVQAAGQLLCWEANVVEFGTAGLLGSTNNTRNGGGAGSAADAFSTTGATTTGGALATNSRRVLQGPNGWASISFGTAGGVTQAAQSITPISSSLNGVADAVPRTFQGLPVVGTSFHNYTNTGIASAYGGVLDHKYGRTVR